MKQMTTCMIWICMFMSYKKWVQREKHLSNAHLPYTKFLCHIGKDVVCILHGGPACVDW